ncbi:hypothetical protein BGZ65_004732 [Modicella reniformis]|uniref:Uncharacterized protein n=1 Tax=Modicella reniformis TaxID=1440133 RepID=A0A9P6MC25_9FUNG|nr:hypothetical protein BGZ65_004732 [Modicella reniformis]
MATGRGLPIGAGTVESRQEVPPEDKPSPTLPSDAEFDSNEEQPARSRTPTSPPGPTPINSAFEGNAQQSFSHHGHSAHRSLPVPAPLRRDNSSYMAFNEIPSLPVFLNNCNLSQYLQSFNEAGAADDSMPLILDFDDNELKSIMEHIPMKPFHAVTFRKGIRDLRERSRMGSMHFDNAQSSFIQPEPHGMLHYSHSQFFQQPSQPSQSAQPSQTSHPSQSQSSLNLSQLTRGYTLQGGLSQTLGLHRQSSVSKSSIQRHNQGSSSPQPPSFLPTPSQVLSGGAIYQYVGPAPRSHNGAPYIPPQPSSLFNQDQPSLSRSITKNESKQLKRRRSSSGTPPETALEESSPIPPEPSSFNSNSSSSWSSTPNHTPSTPHHMDTATKDLIMMQAVIYGKRSSRSLTIYEQAINSAAQSLALEDPSLLTNKGLLWNKAKSKLLEEGYDYKRGKSRSKLPEATLKKDHKTNKDRLIQKREANASNTAGVRLRRIASLGEQLHRKTAEREALLAQLLRLESPEYKRDNPRTFEAEAEEARESLASVEIDRQSISKELGSLKNKERKHQWYEKRKNNRVDNGQDDMSANAGTDAEADDKSVNAGTDVDEEAETDTTVDPDGDASQRSLSAKQGALDQIVAVVTPINNVAPKVELAATATATAATATAAAQKPLAVKPNNAAPSNTVATATADPVKAPASRSKKRKEIFKPSNYTPVVKG